MKFATIRSEISTVLRSLGTACLFSIGLTSCDNTPSQNRPPSEKPIKSSQVSSQELPAQAAELPKETPYLMVLGTAQDAGFPQAGCQKTCCQWARKHPESKSHPTSLGLAVPGSPDKWLFEASPDFPEQIELLYRNHKTSTDPLPKGIFLTHAHIGHYAGLIHLGREVMGSKGVPVYAMPRMQEFLQNNGPWSQLVDLENISLQDLKADQAVALGHQLRVTPFLVPHRDEFSETVGYRIQGPNQSVLFIPDIDKWDKWEKELEAEIRKVDLALLDGTFFANGELPGRDMSQIPHPFVSETMDRLSALPSPERQKVTFIHFNHTNPLLNPEMPAIQQVLQAGYQVAFTGQVIPL